MSHHILLGCGYLGRRIGRIWVERGDTVAALTRSTEVAKELGDEGFLPIIGDVARPESLLELLTGHARPSSLVYAVGYDRRNPQASVREVYAGGLSAVLQAAPEALQKLIYISSTGVYGDAGGDWIDESTPTNPTRPGSVASLAAEEVLTASRFASRGIILRLAGIYGPGRLPYIDALRRGEPIDASPDGYLNLIHADDAARLVAAITADAFPCPGPRTYCVSDGQPVLRVEFYRELAARLGAPTPQFRSGERSTRQERGAASKRVSNRKMRDELGVALCYPSYREGLAHVVGTLSGS